MADSSPIIHHSSPKGALAPYLEVFKSRRVAVVLLLGFASGLPHASICHGNVVGPSRFIHVEQSRAARLAFPNDPSTTPGRNRGVIVCGILTTFPLLSPAARP